MCACLGLSECVFSSVLVSVWEGVGLSASVYMNLISWFLEKALQEIAKWKNKKNKLTKIKIDENFIFT